MKLKNRETKHHQVPQNGIGISGTNHRDNIIMLKGNFHEAFHRIFINRPFNLQIKRLLELNSTSLTNDVKSDIIKLLSNKEKDYWYKNHCFKK